MRPRTGRRLHTAAFDELVSRAGTTNAALAREILIGEPHISDLRSGRRLVTPPIAKALAEALDLKTSESILWPNACEAVAA
jgi:plasmid maintenance system antidote protein VapI